MLEWKKCLKGGLIFTCISFWTENRVTDGAGGQSGSQVLEHAVKHIWGFFYSNKTLIRCECL